MTPETTIATPTIVIAAVLALLTLLVPKRYFLLPYIVAACFVPADQRILIFGLDFTPLRILVIMGLLRMVGGGASPPLKINSFDKLIITWAVVGAIIYVFRWGSFGAVIYKCGSLLDALGMYFLFRKSVTEMGDIKWMARGMAVCSLIMVVFVAIEWTTGQNPFSVMGRVGTVLREGEYRCQGSFPHSIMLGLFWANMVPIFVGLWKAKQERWLYVSAIGACTFIVIATRSSTPLMTLLIIFGLLPLFRYRHHGRVVAWCMLGMTIALHIVMKAPVWHLIARVNMIGGSTGWHRYHLINEAVNHFREWAILGTRGTAHWGYGLFDVTNQYVLEGVRGGLITLILFIIILVKAIAKVGGTSLRKISPGSQWLLWGICVALLGHCVSFIGVSYFGQIILQLYLTFAIVGWVFSNPKQFRLEEALSEHRRRGAKSRGRIDRHRQLEHAGHPVQLS